MPRLPVNQQLAAARRRILEYVGPLLRNGQQGLSVVEIGRILGIADDLRERAFPDEASVYAALLAEDQPPLRQRLMRDFGAGNRPGALGAWLVGLSRSLLDRPGSAELCLRNFDRTEGAMRDLVVDYSEFTEQWLGHVPRLETEEIPPLTEWLLLFIFECVHSAELRKPVGFAEPLERRALVDERLAQIARSLGLRDPRLLRELDYRRLRDHLLPDEDEDRERLKEIARAVFEGEDIEAEIEPDFIIGEGDLGILGGTRFELIEQLTGKGAETLWGRVDGFRERPEAGEALYDWLIALNAYLATYRGMAKALLHASQVADHPWREFAERVVETNREFVERTKSVEVLPHTIWPRQVLIASLGILSGQENAMWRLVDGERDRPAPVETNRLVGYVLEGMSNGLIKAR